MSQRRVLFIARTAKGGSAFSLYHLVKGLDARRYEPVVLFHVQQNPFIGNRLAQAGIKTLTLSQPDASSAHTPGGSIPHETVRRRPGTRWNIRASRSYAFARDVYQFVRWEASKIGPIVRTIQENKVDLVHLNTGLRRGGAGIIAARLTRTPCVSHVRMFDTLSPFDLQLARWVNVFIYISRSVEQHYITHGVSPLKGSVIHNAVDLSEYPPELDGTAVRREFGWTFNERIVGVVGRLDWLKGHEYFLEAMAEVARSQPNLRALIVGDPDTTPRNQAYYHRVQSLTRSLALDDKVIFTGFRPDVPQLLSALDVVVLSSSAPEPFGRVVIEGMAAGRPVVATAAGGVLDIIEDGVSGVLVPCQDAPKLSEAVTALLNDPAAARRIGLAARQRVEEKFSVPAQVAAVQGLYDDLLNAAPGRSARARLAFPVG